MLEKTHTHLRIKKGLKGLQIWGSRWIANIKYSRVIDKKNKFIQIHNGMITVPEKNMASDVLESDLLFLCESFSL